MTKSSSMPRQGAGRIVEVTDEDENIVVAFVDVDTTTIIITNTTRKETAP